MRTFTLASFFVALGLSVAGCGGEVIGEPGTSSTTSSNTTTGSTTTTTTPTTPVVCTGLDFCGCSQAPECEVVYGDCICGCDYQCPGTEPCACACGGGPYFGCAPKSCPGPFTFGGSDPVELDAQGCPFVAP